MTTESVESLCQKARQATAQGKIDQARQLYLQALGLKSNSPDIHYGLAAACFLLHDLDSAAYHFSEVLRLDPMRPGAYVNLGAVLNRLGEYQEAVQILQRGLQIDPNRAEGHYNLGLVYRHLGQLDQAVEAYANALRINPKMIDAHYNLANVYMDQKRFDLAAEHYQHALQMRPNWDKAAAGLQAAQTALAAIDHPPAASAANGSPPAAPALDPDRTLDPEYHGDALRVLYQATTDSEKHGRQYLATIESAIEPAIKDISAALLRPKTGVDLEDSVYKLEKAIKELRNVHASLKESIDKVRTLTADVLQL
jgi:tetratricopeptide (TPR) repeat protein